MEREDRTKFLRVRSIRAITTDGYRLYAACFRRLFRSSWPVAIVYALASALQSSYYINNVLPSMQVLQAGVNDPSGMIAAQVAPMMGVAALTTLLFALTACALAAQGFGMLAEHRATGQTSRAAHWWGRLCLPMTARVVVAVMWLWLLALVIGTPMALLSALLTRNTTGSVMLGLMALGVVLLLMPLAYTVMRHLTAPRASWLPPFSGYATGLRHVGMLLSAVTVVVLVTMVLTAVSQLPAIILYAANMQAQMGAVAGDSVDMPSYMGWMTFGVFTLAGFIQAYLHLSMLFPLYYACGSIEKQQEELNEMKQRL